MTRLGLQAWLVAWCLVCACTQVTQQALGQAQTLVAGGEFSTAGGVYANCIAQWNAAAWSPLSNGLNNPTDSLTVFNNNVVAGGRFTNAGGVSTNNIAQWDGTA